MEHYYKTIQTTIVSRLCGNSLGDTALSGSVANYARCCFQERDIDIMAKKCRKCGVALEGFGYTWIASKLFGVRPSQKDPELCNKCDGSNPAKKKECGCGCRH